MLQANITESRIKNMLMSDKLASPVAVTRALKLELFGLLSQFADVEQSDIKLNIAFKPDGKYSLNMVAEFNKFIRHGGV